MKPRIPIDREKIADFCRKWKITELAFFGSVLREDFRPDSDVDVLVTFEEGAGWSLFDAVDMQQELEKLFGRKVDFVSRRAVEASKNWIRRRSILSTAEPLHVQ